MDTPLTLYLYTILATTFLQANVCYQINFTVDSLHSACVHIWYEEKQTQHTNILKNQAVLVKE